MALRYHFAVILFLAMGASFFTSSPVEAKELHGRMGLGYNAQFAQSVNSSAGVPGLSLKYGLARRLALQIVGGYYSGSNGYGVATAVLENTIFSEPNLNFYWLVGGGWVESGPRSGTEWIGGLGTEFFIPGVESIGISFEAGVSLENVSSSSFVLKTFGVSFLHAGMHFYF